MTEPRPRQALVSGASIAGPTVAYWLSQAGWNVTVVEKAPSIRLGGNPIDLRDTAAEVVKRMGIYEEVKRHQVGARATRILSRRGRRIAVIDVSADILNDDANDDVELPRGDLARILYEISRERVEYVFNDTLVAIEPHEDRVDVTFASGKTDTFDVVIGADGIHSRTRRLVFGPERDYIHHLGPMVAVFELQGSGVKRGEGTMFNLPGRLAMVMRDNTGPTWGFLAFLVDDPAAVDTDDAGMACVLARQAFGASPIPHVRRLLNGMEASQDMFFDTVSQIRMDTWHRGRVGVVGDAAYGPSFMTGQGVSLGVIGAYVLAAELVAHTDPRDAFEAYEGKLREFVVVNQARALRPRSAAFPRDSKSLLRRNFMFWSLPWLKRLHLLGFRSKDYGTTSTHLPIDDYIDVFRSPIRNHRS